MSGICPDCGYNYLRDFQALAEEAIAAKDAEIERLKEESDGLNGQLDYLEGVLAARDTEIDRLLVIREAALALLEYVQRKYPEDRQDDGTYRFLCPFHQRLAVALELHSNAADVTVQEGGEG